jgi:hypothetical protein
LSRVVYRPGQGSDLHRAGIIAWRAAWGALRAGGRSGAECLFRRFSRFPNNPSRRNNEPNIKPMWFRTSVVSRIPVIAVLSVSIACAGFAGSAMGQIKSAGGKLGPANEPRIALVIGNDAYPTARLSNPVNDANEMARTLRDTGFEVRQKNNATQREMGALIREFGERLRGGGVGVFYFAGHGMQIKGRNFLVPVDADIEREDEVAYSAIDAGQVLEKMEIAKNRLNILILDACRNNPFIRSSRAGGQGLAQMDAPVGTLIAFATSPGAVASDGGGKHGLYTLHLLENLRTPGLRLEDVFKNVRIAVRRDSKGKQIPWEATSLEGDFYFVPETKRVIAPVNAADAAAYELSFWETIKTSSDVADFEEYLARYPTGRFAGLARNRVKGKILPPVALKTEPQKPAPESRPPPDSTAPAGQILPAMVGDGAEDERQLVLKELQDHFNIARNVTASSVDSDGEYKMKMVTTPSGEVSLINKDRFPGQIGRWTLNGENEVCLNFGTRGYRGGANPFISLFGCYRVYAKGAKKFVLRSRDNTVIHYADE